MIDKVSVSALLWCRCGIACPDNGFKALNIDYMLPEDKCDNILSAVPPPSMPTPASNQCSSSVGTGDVDGNGLLEVN